MESLNFDVFECIINYISFRDYVNLVCTSKKINEILCGNDRYNYMKDKFVKVICMKGYTCYYLGEHLHREDGPAVVYTNRKAYYYKGKPHREDGPAFIYKGYESWWVDGKRHRNGLPAVICDEHDNHKEWWVNGERHRDNGLPAIESTYHKEWWVNGKRHRDNGLPAIMFTIRYVPLHTAKLVGAFDVLSWDRNDYGCVSTDPYNDWGSHLEWWVNGKRHRVNGPAIKDIDREEWYLNGVLHCDDGGSAVEIVQYRDYWYCNGSYKTQKKIGVHKEWYLNGNLHRVDGPAVKCVDGIEEWYLNGKLHREDGPAGMYDEQCVWYFNGKIHRVDGPAVIMSDGSIGCEWYFNGKLHREGGPAVVTDEKEEWYFNGKLHREDGPAVITDKKEEWWLHGNLIESVEYWEEWSE